MPIELLSGRTDAATLAFRFHPIVDLHRVAAVGYRLDLPSDRDEWLRPARARRASPPTLRGIDLPADMPMLIVALAAPALRAITTRSDAGWVESLLEMLGAAGHTLVVDASAAACPIAGVDLARTAAALRRCGVRWAIGHLGGTQTHLRLWAELGPDFMLVDGELTRGIARSMRRLDIARATVGLGHAMCGTLIATDVTDVDDLAALRDLGVRCAQGPLLGDAITGAPRLPDVAPAVRDALHDLVPEIGSPASHGALKTVLRSLPVVRAPTVGWHTLNDDVFALFESRMDLQALPVVEDERPVALIGRLAFMNAYARPYFRDTSGRASCRALANASPHIVELDAEMQTLVTALMASDQRYLSEGFIVTENGRYVGLGRADELVRAVTELRVEAARHANPLTFLPGNIPISIHIEQLLIENIGFVACYGDLNNFKAFNDHYGYWRGDEMIRLLARIAVRNADPTCDFVGHIGGDDFLILFQSADWRQRCLRMIEQFESAAMRLYDESELEAGGIEGEDRHGVLRFFGFTTLSVGALRVEPGDFEDAQDVANAAALAKHEAKQSANGLTVRAVDGADVHRLDDADPPAES